MHNQNILGSLVPVAPVLAKFAEVSEADIELWLACGHAQNVEGYIRRGRRCRRLSNRRLVSLWKRSVKEYVDDPSAVSAMLIGEMLIEIELRGLPSPEADIPELWLKARLLFFEPFARSIAKDGREKLRREVLDCLAQKRKAEN